MTALLLALAASLPASAAPAAAAGHRAVIAFLAVPRSTPSALDVLSGDGRIEALGLIDLTEGGYNQQQALLNLTQGAWVNRPAYGSADPPPIGLGADGRISDWALVRARAARTPARIEPGLLGSAIPGGAAYVGVGRTAAPLAVVAADRGGRVAAVSLGPARTLAGRTRSALRRFRVVVVEAPDRRRLDQILAGRPTEELVLVLQRPPATGPAEQRPPALLGIGASGLPGSGGRLQSPTTRRPGFVTALDVPASVLRWIGTPIPAAMRGAALGRGGPRDAAALERFRDRLQVIAPRRWPAIDAFLLGWLALLLAGTAVRGRPGARAALRLGGLTALWAPCTVLLTAALAPSRTVEVAVILGGGLLLAAVCDRLVAWPRAPLVPGAAMLVAYTADLSLGSPLISASLLGPNPIAGSRFYGVGNELEAALAVVLFAGLAAALSPGASARRGAVIFGLGGLAFTALVAWGRLGADVGALFTIGGGAAAGALVLRGRLTGRTAAVALAVPFVGLLALAGLDLLTSAGGHFTGTVLHAGSGGEVLDTIRRKAADALRQLRRGVMPINTAVCLGAAAYALRRHERVLAPVGDAAAWRACLVAGFAGGMLGSLTNDSGPVLLVIATFGLGCVLAYLHGGEATTAGAAGGPHPTLRPA